MKKIVLMLTVALLLAATTTAVASNWVDGTYEGWGDFGKRSYTYAKVFVNDGELVGVTLREFTNLDVEKDWAAYSYETAAEAAKTLGAKFVEAQSHDIDILSGATGSSNGYIKAVERALSKAEATEPTNKYFDGTFLGRSYTSSRGYYKIVRVTIENDAIVDLEFSRVLSDHSILDPDEYRFAILPARSAYKAAAIEGNTANVDTISGATGSTGMWNAAVQDALDKASTR